MNLSRRSFLGGVLAVAGATTLARAVPIARIPVIWGDGIHDDAPGLNALFRREPVDILTDAVRLMRGEHIGVCGGQFALRSPIDLNDDRCTHIDIVRCDFRSLPDFEGDALFSCGADFDFSGWPAHVDRWVAY